MKRALIAAVGSAILLAASLPATAAKLPASPTVDSAYALVQLTGAPLSTSARTKPKGSEKVNLASSAVRNERAALARERSAFRTWLRANAPAAKITNEFDLAVNAVGVQLNGTTLGTLRSAPGVTYVEVQDTYKPLAGEDPDLALIHGTEAWASVGGASEAGKGVKVAIIDSGIDVTHPCFDDAGYPAATQLGDKDLTNNKVIVSRVYGNKVVKDGLDGSDLNGHGTHVAGTVACNALTPASVDGAAIPYDPSGVAPAATLGSYNVFPGTEGSGRSEDILEALEDAYADGFDVANMSLGGGRTSGSLLLDNAVNNMDLANMVVAVAAGNEGPGYWTVHYPGAAERALTAGASTVGHSVVNMVTVEGADYMAVVGEFAKLTTDVTAPLKVVLGTDEFLHGLSTACDAATLPDLTGTIALLGRGTCDFTTKVRNAQSKGAVGVLMVDREPGSPFVMAHNGLEPVPTIPAYMVSLEDGLVIKGSDGAPTTLQADGVYVTLPDVVNLMASFSSQGPTQRDLLIKPDVVAPGANVLSAQPAWACETDPCWAFFGGTSMATPHLAGTAAVVRGDHPTWTAEQVRSAVVNTAQQNLLKHPETGVVTNDPLIVGSGLVDVSAAVDAVAGLSPVSKSFANWSSGAGGKRSANLTLTNLGTSARTFSWTVQDTASDGVTFSGTSSVTVAAGASATIPVTATAVKSAADGHKWATLRISTGGDEVAHAMLYALVGEGDRAPGQHQVPPGQS